MSNESVSAANSNGSQGRPDTPGGRVLSAQGLPVSDDYALAPSPHRFEDGGHFRLEVSGVERLATLDDGRIVAVRQGSLLGTSFHPEVTGEFRFHRLFLDMVRDRAR